MDEKQFEQALKIHPCPECETVGFLVPQHMTIKAIHKGHTIEAKGDGTMCRACNCKFMSDELTESIANQVQHIDGGFQRYIEVDRQTGKLQAHSIQ